MRTFVQCSLALVSFAAIPSVRAMQLAEEGIQPPGDVEEVIVRGGKSLSQWRLEVDQAQDELFELFNEINEGKDNDVGCRDEVATGSRIPQRACWSHAQERAGAAGARLLLKELFYSSGHQGNADRGMAQAMSNATREGRIAGVRFHKEWARVLGEDRQFAEAVAEYAALKAEFDRISGVTSVSAPQPRQITLGPAGSQCEASPLTDFQQLDDVARVSGTVSISACPSGTTGASRQWRKSGATPAQLRQSNSARRGSALTRRITPSTPITQSARTSTS